MAREELLHDTRTFLLMRALKIDRCQAIGFYEYSHLLAYASRSHRYANKAHFEALMEWRGKPNALADAMIDAGFIDKGKGHELELARFYDECPDYVYKRAGCPPAPNRAVPRGSARNGAEPPDPSIRSDPSQEETRLTPRSRSRSRPESGSTVQNPQVAGAALPKPAGKGLEAAGSVASGLLGMLLAGKSLEGFQDQRTDWGSLSERELVERLAALETKIDPVLAKKLWAARVREMAEHPGGLEFCKKLGSYIDYNRSGKRLPGEKPINAPGRYMNHCTKRFLQEKRKAAS